MSTHKVYQLKVNLFQLVTLFALLLTLSQAVPAPKPFANETTTPAASLVVDGGHTIDVG